MDVPFVVRQDTSLLNNCLMINIGQSGHTIQSEYCWTVGLEYSHNHIPGLHGRNIWSSKLGDVYLKLLGDPADAVHKYRPI